MWKKMVISLLLGAVSLYFVADYHLKKAYAFQKIYQDAVASDPWLFSYLNIVENLHIQSVDSRFQKNIFKWSEKLPFLKDVLDRLQLSDGLTSLEAHLHTLSLKYDFINQSIVRYPANRWAYRYTKYPENLDQKEIAGLVVHAVYDLSQEVNDYSIEGLKGIIDYRNLVVMACETNEFNDWVSIGGNPTCVHVKATIIEEHWRFWFDYSGHARNYLPRLIGNYARLSVLKHASLEVCNFTPYKTQSIIQNSLENGLVKVYGWYHYDVGECRTFNETFIDVDPEFWVHMRHDDKSRFDRVTRQVNEALLSDTNANNDQIIVKQVGVNKNIWNDSRQCVSMEAFTFEAERYFKGTCIEKSDGEVSFAKAMPSSATKEKWYFFTEHPNLAVFNPRKKVSNPVARNAASKRAIELKHVIDRQYRFEQSWNSNQIPFSLGASIYDHNGSLARGVMLHNVATQSIGGASLPYRNGGILLSLNGKSIYGISDLYGELIRHGFSLSAGYNKPLKVGLERDGKIVFYQTTYFFNENHPQFFDVSEAEATAWGIGDAVTFGITEEIKCKGRNVVAFSGNVLSGLFEFADSIFQDRKFNKQSLKQFGYIDTEKCEWQDEQRKAIAQQRYQDTYINSQWFALFTPSAVRLAGQKAFRNYTKRNIAKRALGVAIADGMLEGVETSLWSMGTAAPELTLEARLKDAGGMAPYGVGLGFISGLVFAKAGIGGK